MIQRKQFENINELPEALSPYISARTLTRICGMSER